MSPLASLLLATVLLAGQEHGRPHGQGQGQFRGQEKVFEQVVIERDSYALYMDLYGARGEAPADGHEPMLVLFHDSRSSRGEYRPIAPRLTAAGYTCLAVDLGLGRESRGVRNRSAYTAQARGHDPDAVQALGDVESALLWAREHHPLGPVVAWGDGYSAGLALVVAAIRPDLADGALAFSPSECFQLAGKSATWVADTLAECQAPVFLTGAANEAEVLRVFQAACPGEAVALHVPATGGVFGAKALWDDSEGHEDLWRAVETFLAAHFPVTAPAAVPEESPAGPR